MIAEILANPYFSAGFGLIGVGTSLALLKQGALKGSDLLRRKIFLTLEISSKDKSYSWVLQWLTNQVAQNTQHLSVETSFKQHENGSSCTKFSMIPSPGIHYMKWKSRWFKVHRERERSMMDITNGLPFETVTITTIGQDRLVFDEMLNEARSQALTKEIGKTVIFTGWANEWRQFGLPRRKRKLESVILDTGIAERLTKDVIEFIGNGKWYFDRGIPYRRGYLLYGPPGTGKSSFIQALAGELDYNICIINLSENVLTDDRFNYLLSVLPERSFLLLEDIDAAFLNRNNQNQGRITFSGLLNALDGVGSSEERIVFMTTNHYEKLDPALIRPGRVDYQQFIGLSSEPQITKMFDRFYPNNPDLSSKFLDKLKTRLVSTAQLQGHFILYKDSPELAIDNIDEIFNKESMK